MSAGRCVVYGAALRGVEAILVEVEVLVSSGLPGFNIVGMADAAVQESKERVRAALKQSGFRMPPDKIVVNLAPSSLRKTGAGFDLAIAVGILAATGQVPFELTKGRLFAGELSLDGRVRSIDGLLAYGLCARDNGLKLVTAKTPVGLMAIEDLEEQGLGSLNELVEEGYSPVSLCDCAIAGSPLDYSEVSGNEMAKRALQIAAAGGHGVLMMGPPGSGKTMLAERFPTILPPLDQDELLDCALIHSVAGEPIEPILAGVRPFRAPHHSATSPALIGGSSPIKPGEVSFAHHGVLFLDELAEFKPSVLQQMRQPMEEGSVRIARAEATLSFPARFMLIGASNPCPCGFYGDEEHSCTCPELKVREYQNRIGGPLMDRIDIHIDVKRVDPEDVIEAKRGVSSEELRGKVLEAREYSAWRKSRSEIAAGSHGLIDSCQLSTEDETFFERAAVRSAMSARAIVRTLSVARTIADMNKRLRVERADLCEALSFRVRDGVGAP